MKEYLIENAVGQHSTQQAFAKVLDALQYAETLHPQRTPTGWFFTTRQGKTKYHRWEQYAIVDMMLERTGVIVDCFDTRPISEDLGM